MIYFLQLHSLPESMVNLQNLELLDLYSNTFEEVPEILKNMSNLKAVDLEYNCFDVLGSLKNESFLDRYICMKSNMRLRLTRFPVRVDCQRPPLDCDASFSDGMILLIVVHVP
jgi:Leucine-rich repeat (LRR) protein